jgi:hypothetical protein
MADPKKHSQAGSGVRCYPNSLTNNFMFPHGFSLGRSTGDTRDIHGLLTHFYPNMLEVSFYFSRFFEGADVHGI